MPNEGKSSPSFQEVRPAMLPLHSFRQTLFPIRRASAGERVMSAVLALVTPVVAQEKTQFKDTKDKSSYAIGVNVGTNFGKQKIPLNVDAFAAGVKDGMA